MWLLMKPHVTEPPELVSILDQFSITFIFFIIPCQEMASRETKVEVKTWYSLTDFLLYRDQCLQSTNKQTKNIYYLFNSTLFLLFLFLLFTCFLNSLHVFFSIYHSNYNSNKSNSYPTALRRVQITPKTSTNMTRYLYSRGPVRKVSCCWPIS